MAKKKKEEKLDISDKELFLFGEKSEPDPEAVRYLYDRGINFMQQINLFDNVKVNENFYIGKQWEGVETNGLPTPQINILKRVVGFIVASITSDNIKVNATALANTVGTSGYKEICRIINDEFEAIFEQNNISAMNREFMRNAAVDGDGCIYTYFDPKAESGQKVKGRIVSEIVENTRIIVANPNDRRVQSQPYIIMAIREPVRNVRLRAKRNGVDNWREIRPDSYSQYEIDDAKYVDDIVTVMKIFWKDDETDEVWCYECTDNVVVKEAYNMEIKLYPFVWLNWDYVQDSFYGQAMITGLIPNQVFINKSWAMTMLSIMKSAFSKVVYDSTRIKKWDNRVGSAIGVAGGDINTVAKIIDAAPISPQVSQYIQLAVEQTEQSLGATSVALGDTRPDNTSAIIALQRAASTPSELTKQNDYRALEDLCRIYLEFMSVNYGTRYVDSEPTDMERQAVEFARQYNPDIEMPEEVPIEFDFAELKKHPVTIKLDIGASSYFSEIASTQTLDNLFMQGKITASEYFERVPDYMIPAKRALYEKYKAKEEQAEQMQQMQMQQQMGMQMPQPQQGGEESPTPQKGGEINPSKADVHGGGGYSGLQRAINKAGDTKGIV